MIHAKKTAGTMSQKTTETICDEEYAPGCSVLGYMYANGYGVDKDYSTAASLFKKGCDGGDAYGCKALESLIQ